MGRQNSVWTFFYRKGPFFKQLCIGKYLMKLKNKNTGLYRNIHSISVAILRKIRYYLIFHCARRIHGNSLFFGTGKNSVAIGVSDTCHKKCQCSLNIYHFITKPLPN